MGSGHFGRKAGRPALFLTNGENTDGYDVIYQLDFVGFHTFKTKSDKKKFHQDLLYILCGQMN
jgi:hypothetical protein